MGGSVASAASTVAFNGEDGVSVEEGEDGGFIFVATANKILRNSTFSYFGLGIDLLGGFEDAVGNSANDGDDAAAPISDPDKDTGPNGLQNKPELNFAATSGDTTTIRGVLDTKVNTAFTVQFFSQSSGDVGKRFVGQRQVTTDSDGRVTFTFRPTNAVAVGQKITGTATGPEGTSEFSTPREVTAS